MTTLRPWKVDESTIGYTVITNGDDRFILQWPSEQGKYEAALIVQAVNSHEALCEALNYVTRSCVNSIDTPDATGYTKDVWISREAIIAVEAALTLAQKVKP